MLLSRSAIPLLVTATCLGSAAHAQTAKVDPQAQPVLDAMMAAYPALHSYSATIEVTDTVGKNPRGSVQTTRIVFQRPNEALVVSDGTEGHAKVLSDGTNIYDWEPPAKPGAKPTYHQALVDSQADGVTTALQMGEHGGTMLVRLLGSRGFLTEMSTEPGLTSLTLGPEGKTDGVLTQTVRMAWKERAGEDMFTFSIGKNDHLLRRLDIGAHRTGKPVLILRTEKYTNVQANPKLDAATFHVTLPRGSKITP